MLTFLETGDIKLPVEYLIDCGVEWEKIGSGFNLIRDELDGFMMEARALAQAHSDLLWDKGRESEVPEEQDAYWKKVSVYYYVHAPTRIIILKEKVDNYFTKGIGEALSRRYPRGGDYKGEIYDILYTLYNQYDSVKNFCKDFSESKRIAETLNPTSRSARKLVIGTPVVLPRERL